MIKKVLVDERKEVAIYFVSTFLLYGGLNGSCVVAVFSWRVSMQGSLCLLPLFAECFLVCAFDLIEALLIRRYFLIAVFF